ncbi:MAG: OprO/OprP family phosphate-selective porin [Gammaproteobacteria bacterium]|nr:porin [Gammaproteobacteria bacterium]
MTKRLSFLMVFALLAMTPMAAAFDDTSKKAKGVDDNNEAAASEAEDDPKFLHWEEHYRATVIRTQVGEADIKLSTYRGLELKWRDFTAHVGGKIFVDYAHYFEDKNDLGANKIGLRVLSLFAEGMLTKTWAYKITGDLFSNGGQSKSGGGIALSSFYVRYLGFDPTLLTYGVQTEPFSLEVMTGNLDITFMERALPSALAPGDTVGIKASTYRERWSIQGGLFGPQVGSLKDQGDQGTGLTGRVTTLPIQSKLPFRTDFNLLHVGVSASIRDISSSEDVSFRNRPESGLTDVRYVNTGVIEGADAVTRIGLEAAAQRGPYALQGEYMRADVGRGSGFPDVHFDGWYIFASWFPTGEQRRYVRNGGYFGGVEPTRKYGAIELAVRYSTIDFNSRDIRGGRENNVTLGVNWYINEQMRVMANYIYVDTDIFANDDGKVRGDDSPHIIQLRFQYDF